jgi:hypothetical protein
VSTFCSFFSDNENPRKDAATAPLVDAPAVDEPPSQEAAVVAKSPDAPVKKGTSSHASKRLKKVPIVSTSLDTHRPVSSADDVSTIFWWLALFTALNCSSHVFLLTDFYEKNSSLWALSVSSF